jgi:hypothetical protein
VAHGNSARGRNFGAHGSGGDGVGPVHTRHVEMDGRENPFCGFSEREADGGGGETVLTGAAGRLTVTRLNRWRRRISCSQLYGKTTGGVRGT